MSFAPHLQWLLGALNVVAGNVEVASRVFVDAAHAAEGFFVVRLWAEDPQSDDDWAVVLVDDRIPCGADGQPRFGRGAKPGALWAALVEKAVAKRYGSYQALEGDGRGEATLRGLELVTGGKARELPMPSGSAAAQDMADGWNAVREALNTDQVRGRGSGTGVGTGTGTGIGTERDRGRESERGEERGSRRGESGGGGGGRGGRGGRRGAQHGSGGREGERGPRRGGEALLTPLCSLPLPPRWPPPPPAHPPHPPPAPPQPPPIRPRPPPAAQVVAARCDACESISEEAAKLGIVPDRTYCVIVANELMGSHKLLRLRGFAGDAEWSGRWSDDSKEWTSRLRNMLRYSKE